MRTPFQVVGIGWRRRIPGVLALALLTVAGVSGVHAQNADKKTPPETGILPQGPPGGGQAVPDSLAKQETLPPLALPDIVVFGRATSMMRDGSKLFPSDKRTVLEREIGAETGEKGTSHTGLGGGRITAAAERAPALSSTRLFARGGTFAEVLAGIDHWRDSGRWRLTLQGTLDRTSGHTTGSERLGGTVGATATHLLAGGSELGFAGSFGTGRQEEWGAGIPALTIPAAPAGAERKWLEATYGTELRGPLGAGFRYRAALRGRYAGLRDEVRGTAGTIHPASTGGEIGAELEWLRRNLRLYASAGMEGDRASGPLAERTDRLTTLRIGAEALLGDTSSLRLGVVGFLFDGALGSVTRLWPEAGITMRYSDRFSMHVRYRPNLTYMSLGEARRENPFVANTYQVVPTEEKFHLGIGLRYALAPGVSAGFEVVRRQFDRLAVWRRAPLTESESDGLFVLDGLASVGLNETRLVLEGPISDRLEVEAAAVLVNPTGGAVDHLPHIPPWRLEGELRLQGPWRLHSALTVLWLAERFGDTSGDPDRSIAAVADLGARFSWPLKESADIWLELGNLLGQESALWEGYTLPGRISALGISVRF